METYGTDHSVTSMVSSTQMMGPLLVGPMAAQFIDRCVSDIFALRVYPMGFSLALQDISLQSNKQFRISLPRNCFPFSDAMSICRARMAGRKRGRREEERGSREEGNSTPCCVRCLPSPPSLPPLLRGHIHMMSARGGGF